MLHMIERISHYICARIFIKFAPTLFFGQRSPTYYLNVGKGESHELTLDGCMKSWKRAEMLNHKEAVNLRMRHDYINRHAHMLEEKQKRTVENIEGSFRTMRAYHSLMTGDFKADNFDTLVWGYKTPDAVQALRRQVNRRLEEMQHDKV